MRQKSYRILISFDMDFYLCLVNYLIYLYLLLYLLEHASGRDGDKEYYFNLRIGRGQGEFFSDK